MLFMQAQAKMCLVNELLYSNRGEEILEELGLTSAQARTYMALCRLSKASAAKTISASANITRQDIYNTLIQLQQLSLIEIALGKPVLYRAIPIIQVITILAERRKQKTDSLLTEAKALLSLSKMDEIADEEEHQFLLIPKKETCTQKIKKTIHNTKGSMVIIAPWRETTQWLFTLHESLIQALDRSVEIRVLSQEPQAINLTKGITELFKYPNFKLRLSPDPCEVRFGIYDDQEAIVATLKSDNAAESPALWTSNPAMMHLLRYYFEDKWGTAKDFTGQQPLTSPTTTPRLVHSKA
jgi:sugar-specific transcriptional regulator TrmB